MPPTGSQRTEQTPTDAAPAGIASSATGVRRSDGGVRRLRAVSDVMSTGKVPVNALPYQEPTFPDSGVFSDCRQESGARCGGECGKGVKRRCSSRGAASGLPEYA